MIPSGFPITRPRTIPHAIGLRAASAPPLERDSRVGEREDRHDRERDALPRSACSMFDARVRAGTVKASSTPAIVACTPRPSTNTQSATPTARRRASRPHPHHVEQGEQREHQQRTADRRPVQRRRIEEGDHEDGAEVVGDGERGEEHAESARHALAEQGEHAERERDVRRHGHAPPATPLTAERSTRSRARPATSMPPSAAATGSVAERLVERSPTSTSRFISSPTRKKKTAMSASFTQWWSDNVSVKRRMPTASGISSTWW